MKIQHKKFFTKKVNNKRQNEFYLFKKKTKKTLNKHRLRPKNSTTPTLY